MIDRKQNKKIHAIVFFLENTKFCYKSKLFKLLYFLDFEHFRQTGHSVTGLDYFAFKRGPVPTDLYSKIEDRDSEITKFFSFKKEENLNTFKIIAKIPFDKNLFSKREIKIMEYLSLIFEEAKANKMSAISHNKTTLWEKICSQKPQSHIPYHLVLDNKKFIMEGVESISLEEAKEIYNDEQSMQKMFA